MQKAVISMIIFQIFFLSLIIPSTYSAIDYTKTNKNFSALISNVHQYFGTSCIFVVHSRRETEEEISRLQRILRQFSAQRILSVSVEFGRLKETIRFYSKRVIRSLIVVSLRNGETVAQFANLTNYFDMHTSCWLLLFEDDVYSDNYNALKPGDNIFSLRFDTEMLVARRNHSIVQEWYWLRNRIKIEDLAVWDFGTGFDLITNKSLWHRRTNLEHTPIVVTTVNNPPMTSFVDNKMGGLFGKIFEELSRAANCTVEFISPNEMSYGSWHPKEKRWTGMINMLVTGQASIAAADFTITTSRLEAVDFSLPMISTSDKLYIRKPDPGICWSSYWETLAPGIWMLIQVCILFTTMLLTVITVVRRYRITTDIFSGYFLLVFGIYCQQGLPEFPNDLPSQIAYFSIFLSALIVSAAYAAALTSFLTVTGINLPFNSIEEFVDDGTYKLIVFRDGAEYDMFMSASDPVLFGMSKLMDTRTMLPVTLKSGFQRVCKEKVAFYIPAPLEESIRALVPCKVIGIGTKRTMSLAMALSKENPYHGVLNYHVQRFRDHGILNRLKNDFAIGYTPQSTKHVEVSLWGIFPILAVLGGGILLALFILYVERIFFATTQSRGLIQKGKRQKLGMKENEEISKIRLRNRSIYLTNYYP